MVKVIVFIIGIAVLTFTNVSSEDVQNRALVIDGVDVTTLNHVELQTFCKALDEKLGGELDLHVFKSLLGEKTGRRKKRFVFWTLTMLAGKMLATSFVVGKLMTIGGDGPTTVKLYNVYATADTGKDVYDTFSSLRPNNVETNFVVSGFNGEERVMNGDIGDIKVSARIFGPSGLPTLELSSKKVVREIRFPEERHSKK